MAKCTSQMTELMTKCDKVNPFHINFKWFIFTLGHKILDYLLSLVK